MGDAKERPILFSGPMVRAILEGRKSQTRRVVDERQRCGYPHDEIEQAWPSGFTTTGDLSFNWACPCGQSGDRLWVRETWGYRGRQLKGSAPERSITFIRYQADDARREFVRPWDDESGLPKQRERREGETADAYDDYLTAYWKAWRPSIHMPRWASRLTLEVTEVRVQRLQDISEEDAKAEGVGESAFVHEGNPEIWAKHAHERYRLLFQGLWHSINGERPGCSWDANPWVWAITFNRITDERKA